jgi:hypothetical protein
MKIPITVPLRTRTKNKTTQRRNEIFQIEIGFSENARFVCRIASYLTKVSPKKITTKPKRSISFDVHILGKELLY